MKSSFLFLILLLCFVSASDVPGLPMIIEGNVLAGDDLASIGTLVDVRIDNVSISEYTLIEDGEYVLTVDYDEDFDGKEMVIYVDNQIVREDISYSSGSVVSEDLYIEKKGGWAVYIVFALVVFVVLGWLYKAKVFKKEKS